MGKQIGLHDTMKYYSPIKNSSIKMWVGVKKWLVTVVGRAYRVMPQVCGNWKLVTVKHQRHCYWDSHYKLVNCIQSEFYLNKRKCQIKIIKPSSFFSLPSALCTASRSTFWYNHPQSKKCWPCVPTLCQYTVYLTFFRDADSTGEDDYKSPAKEEYILSEQLGHPISLKPVIQGCYY